VVPRTFGSRGPAYGEGAGSETVGRRRNNGFRYDRRKAFRIGRVLMATLLKVLLVLILVRLLQ
jgi:hypothetical protein